MNIPSLPAETKPFLWGAVAGAVALAIIGFNWGGWVTGGTAEDVAMERVDDALVSALSPICVAQFQDSDNSSASLVALKEIKTWEQGDFVAKGGWATMPGSTAEPNRQVARACAARLNELAL